YIGDDALQACFRVDPITPAPFRPESISRRARLLQGAGTPRLELVADGLRAVSHRGDNDVDVVRQGIDGMKRPMAELTMPSDRPFHQPPILVREGEFRLLHPRSGPLDQERIGGLDFGFALAAPASVVAR